MEMKRTIKLVVATVAAFQLAGCATVTRGTTETVHFHSEPEGATVSVDGRQCITPCDMELKRKGDKNVRYETAEGIAFRTMLESSVAGAGVVATGGNVILGGLIGIVVDASSGANLSLKPNPMVVDFTGPDPRVMELNRYGVEVTKDQARTYCRSVETTNGMINKCINDVQKGKREMADQLEGE